MQDGESLLTVFCHATSPSSRPPSVLTMPLFVGPLDLLSSPCQVKCLLELFEEVSGVVLPGDPASAQSLASIGREKTSSITTQVVYCDVLLKRWLGSLLFLHVGSEIWVWAHYLIELCIRGNFLSWIVNPTDVLIYSKKDCWCLSDTPFVLGSLPLQTNKLSS